MVKKHTTAQLSILRYLNDGDRIYRHWSRFTGNWIVVGDWGRDAVSKITVQFMIKAGLVEVTDRIVDWKYLRLTPAGRAALAETSREVNRG
jgi:hypothetical protein